MKWARSVNAERIRTALDRKAIALPCHSPELRYAVAAREQVRDVPRDILAITASDIFS
ncbi:MAG: hypothetical protein ACREN8_04815 [Candidatus Dormibacteraceae bacterium]